MIEDPLDPALRELIVAGRDRLGPDAATVARLRTRIDNVVAAKTPLTAKSVMTKLVLVAVLGGVGTGLYLRGGRLQTGSLPPPPAIIEIEVPSSPSVGLSTHERPPPVSAQDAHARAAVEPTRSVARAPTRGTATPVQNNVATTEDASAPPPQQVHEGVSLAREIELIDRSTRLMRQGDPASALDSLRIYDRESAGSGQLAEDAAALRVEILCRVRDERAVEQLVTFDRQWPRSAQRRRLAAACESVAKER